MRISRGIVLGFPLFICLVGCGPVFWTVDSAAPIPDSLDGALLSYTLAQGEVTFSVSYTDSTQVLSLTSDQVVTGKPDYARAYVLAYSHNAFSSDDITVDFKSGLITKISASTQDQTITAIQTATALLTQIAATQTALSTTPSKGTKVAADVTAPKCGDIKAQNVFDVTHGVPHFSYTQFGNATCEIKITVVRDPTPLRILGIAGFPTGPLDHPDKASCNFAVCFRIGGAYHLRAVARIQQIYKGKILLDQSTEPLDFTVLAPVEDAIGFIRFNRRAFVQNKASISFDSTGLVSEFTATNPSEIVGWLQLPSELLKGVSAAVVIH